MLSSPPQPRIRVLCVDDQLANLTALEGALGGVGYDLVLAQSGREALELIRHDDFAVILLDVQMPVMHGFEAARLIREIERARATPIIFLTANYPSEDYVLQAYEAGAVDYLFKPLNIQVLRAKVAVFAELFLKNAQISRQAELLRRIEQREKERELAEVRRIGEKKYEDLVEGIREGIVWSADRETLRFSYVSRHAEKITGYPMSRWLEDPEFLRSAVPEDEMRRILELIRGALTETARAGIEHRFVRADGHVMWFHTELHTDKNELRGLSVDVTHLKESEVALKQAVQIRDEFLSIASHELKTPITPLQLQMQSFIRMIETGRLATASPDILKSMLELADTQVTRLARLIEQLLDVSRISGGKLALERQETRLAPVVSGVVEQLKHELENSKCSLELKVEADPRGHWDPLRIEQVIFNLIGNSIRYAAGKPIEVTLGRDGNRAILQVKDQGMGIARKDQERIFERFERAVPSRNFGGLGLGLYITRQIVELHDGDISVKSEPGQGAIFTVELPAEYTA